MLSSASPGIHGISHPSIWSNSEKFIEFQDHFMFHVKCTKDKFLLHVGSMKAVKIAAVTKVKRLAS
jgi:hypothetical protein